MDSFMHCKTRAVPERLPTPITYIRLLSRVDPFVLRKKGAVTEGLPTLSTFEGFLPKMDSLMAY